MTNRVITYMTLIALLALFQAALPNSADAAGPSFKGKRVVVYIGTPPGGGYDAYGRTLARHIGRYIPGKPSIIAKNVPAASGLVLANNLYNRLPKDGTAIGVFPRGQITQPLFGNKQARFDATKFNWIGSINKDVSVCMVWHTAQAQTTAEFLKKPVIMGGSNPGGTNQTNPLVLNNIIGANLRVVAGYPGGADINLAMERGEVEGRCGISWSSVKARTGKWLEQKKIKILLQMSTFRHPELPNVPIVTDFAKSDKDRQTLQLIFALGAFGRPFMVPPGVPSDTVKMLRTAFMATMGDKKFLAAARKRKLEVQPVSGEEVQRLIAKLYAAPKDVVAAAKDAQSNTSKSRISQAKIPTVTVKGVITKVRRGGRRVSFKGGGRKFKTSVSGRRTKVTIDGKKAKRSKLKVGMKCSFTTRGSAAKAIAC